MPPVLMLLLIALSPAAYARQAQQLEAARSPLFLPEEAVSCHYVQAQQDVWRAPAIANTGQRDRL